MNSSCINRLGAWLALCLCAIFSTLHAAEVPRMLHYQGRVSVGGAPFDGIGKFKFALISADGSISYWSNDGSSASGSEPTKSVTITVTKGLYSVMLGDADLANMTEILPDVFFNNNDSRLRVWFNDGTHGSQLLSPDQRIVSVAYAMVATTVADGGVGSGAIAPGAIQTEHISGNSVTRDQLRDDAAVFSLNGLFGDLTLKAGPNITLTPGTDSITISASGGSGGTSGWGLTGNAGLPANAFLGTTDSHLLKLGVGGVPALVLSPGDESPNIMGGPNSISGTPQGVAIMNGLVNNSGAWDTFVGSGTYNKIISGADSSSIVGGDFNYINGAGLGAFIGGGSFNQALNHYATVPGGSNNVASGKISLAAGRRAKAAHDGAFVWADSTDADFTSTAANQFLVRATGGVGINTTNPTAALEVAGDIKATTVSGNGAGLTALNASNLGSGTLPDTRLSGNVAMLNNSQTFNGANTFNERVGVSAAKSGDFDAAVARIENKSTTDVTSPALRVVSTGNTANGALNVSANGTGKIAVFGNRNEWVANLDTNGTLTAKAFVGDGSGLGNLSLANLSQGIIPDARLSANVALQNGNVEFINELKASGGMRLSDDTIYLRGGTDKNHGLAYYGSGTSFGGVSPDGPVLFGFGGGALGTTYNGAHSVLTWNDHSINVSGTHIGGFGEAIATIENKSTANNTAPALWVVGNGLGYHGALNVTANGSGPIAHFGNATETVVKILGDGSINSDGSIEATGTIGGAFLDVGDGNVYGDLEVSGKITAGTITAENVIANNTPAVNWNQQSSQVVVCPPDVSTTICSEGNAKPAPGFFVIQGFVYLQTNCRRIDLHLMDVTSAPRNLVTVSSHGGGLEGSTIPITWVVPISQSGGYQNFALSVTPASDLFTDNTTQVDSYNLTVMYFPRQNN